METNPDVNMGDQPLPVQPAPTTSVQKIPRLACGKTPRAIQTTSKGTVQVDPFTHQPISSGSDGDTQYQNSAQKDLVLGYILIMCKYIMGRYFNCFDCDIRISNDAMSILRTCHNYLRKNSGKMLTDNDANKKAGIGEEIEMQTCGLLFNINTIEICKTMLVTCTHFDLDYQVNKKLPNNWFSTAAPLICYLSTFKNRVDELRLGTTQFTVKKNKDKPDETATIMSYGFQEIHSALATAISYPPEIRSSMVKATGPVTQMIGLLTNPSKPYCDKFISSLSETFKFIQGNESIWKAIASKPTSAAAKSIVRNMADIALLCTARHHHKATIPAVMLFSLIPPALNKHYFNNFGTTAHVFPNTKCLGEIKDDHYLCKIDFSGSGLFHFLATFKQHVIMPKMNVEMAQQILFHGIFGTQFEEQTILSKMTGVNNWYSRNQLGAVFHKLGSKVETMTVEPIVPIFGSRMRKAILTKMNPSLAPQVIATPVFSGMQEHPLLKMFIDAIDTEIGKGIGAMTDIDEINKGIAQARSSFIDQIRGKKEIVYGSCKWYRVNPVWPPPPFEALPFIDETFKGKNLYFNAIDATKMDLYEPKDEDNTKAKKARLESIKGM